MTTLIVDALLGETRPEILTQWEAGELVRRGGVLYRRSGLPGGGRIVAHLRDVGEAAGGVVSPLSRLAGLTQVAAAASVVGLGVSIAGFAATLYKLHQLQKSLSALAELSRSQHADTVARLDGIVSLLVEVKAAQARQGAVLEEVLSQVQLVRIEQSLAHIAKVRAAVELLQATGAPTETQYESAERSFREAAVYFELTIGQSPLRRDRPTDWIDTLTRFRGWCLATVAEVTLARRRGRTDAAAALAEGRAQIAREWCGHWSKALMPPEEFGGVFRFSHRRFATMPREEFARLVRMQEGEVPIGVDPRELSSSHALSLEAPSLALGWWESERAMADMLDFCEEATARIESLASEMVWCRERKLGWNDWEALPVPADAQGIALVLREG